MSTEVNQSFEATNSMGANPAGFETHFYTDDMLSQMNTLQLIKVSGAEALGSNRQGLLDIAAHRNPNLHGSVLSQMNTAQLVALSGAEAVGSNRDELLEIARKKQVNRLGSYISALGATVELPKIQVPTYSKKYPELTLEGQVPRPIKVDDDVLGRSLVSYISRVSPAEQPVVTLHQTQQINTQEIQQRTESLPTVYMPTTIPSQLEVSRQLKSPNVLSNNVRKALSNTLEALTPSRKKLGRVVAGLALFSVAYNFLPGISFNSAQREGNGESASGAVADSPISSPAETIPTETTIEVITTTTPDTIPATTAAPEQTTTTIEVTTTTEELSLYEKVLQGEADRSQLSGSLIAKIDIPSLCLSDIDAYGSMKRASNDPVLLDAYLESGVLTQAQHDLLLSGKAPHSLEVYLFDHFDPTYKLYPSSSPQEACEDVVYNPAYPQRWLRTLDDASKPGMETEKLSAVEPVVDINWEYGLPGEAGNVIVSGHRTTMSAPFANLDQLEPGQTVTFRTVDGKEYTYVVEATELASTDEEFAKAMNYMSPSGIQEQATFVTCDDGSAKRIVQHMVLQKEA